MSDPGIKQVKVDNWGIYFLQRLKHFFNRTDYCDLTLQFQDNAQLKVHRLVLSACTEYFELLERTCEMYEDCLVMPDDLQADVVVPIVNFMYTGQLEFRLDLLERLYQTSLIMNMPVLTKLLDAHRSHVIQESKSILSFNNTPVKRSYSKSSDKVKQSPSPISNINSAKRTFQTAFSNTACPPNKKPSTKQDTSINNNGTTFKPPSPSTGAILPTRKVHLGEPRPTRYELPEELDTDNLFENSFSNISYTSQPLMVHPETTKHYTPKKSKQNEAGSSKSNTGGTSTLNILESKKYKSNSLFDDDVPETVEETVFYMNPKNESPKISNQLFDQIIEQDTPKITIETKGHKQANIDHAKIISEVLKKYPHLVKSNKNIKLKVLDNPVPTKSQTKSVGRQRNSSSSYRDDKGTMKTVKTEPSDYSYETDVLDSKEAARLIALGAENVKGPWICLICGTPGRALHFTSYYQFRRHLVEVHNEKPVSNMCEYCGLKSYKRNYLLHHMYTKHGVEPPPAYKFPKCNCCSYVALTESFLVRHKLNTHTVGRNFRCNVCSASYGTSNQLLTHIQATGHKYSGEKKSDLQCVYCLKVFSRESNLYTHLKTLHKESAKSDGIIDVSDDEKQEEEMNQELKPPVVKFEPSSFDQLPDSVDTQYQINPDGNIQLITKKIHPVEIPPTKQKILNAHYDMSTSRTQLQGKKTKSIKTAPNVRDEYPQPSTISPEFVLPEEVIMIDNNEYVMRDNKLVRKRQSATEFILPNMLHSELDQSYTSTAPMEYSNIHDTITDNSNIQEQTIIMPKQSSDINQPIQIVVTSEEEYKALLNSNHSIIFDDRDANKTLTVLSTPHSATLNTTSIDLDNNTQSNDMMIIPENYPINVSEALPVNNSNIVVVYSHSVNDENKQYQIITSQSLGAQYVQSSAVITPNYEGINTPTPVMSAHVIDTEATETWQNNIQETEQVHMQPSTELQEMTLIQEDGLNTTVTESHDAISELPEVTLTATKTQETAVEESISKEININGSNIVNTESMDTSAAQEATENVLNIASTPLEENTSNEIPTDTIAVAEEISDVEDHIIISQNNEVEDHVNIPQDSAVQDEEIHEEQLTQIIVTRDHEMEEEMPEEELNKDDTEIYRNPEKTEIVEIATDSMPQEKEVPEEANDIEKVTETHDQVTVPVEATEQTRVVATEQIPVVATEQMVVATEQIPVVATEQIPVVATEQIPIEATEQIPVVATEQIPGVATEQIPVVATEQIQTLASEWSEDEDDAGQNSQVIDENVIESVQETEDSVTKSPGEVEESIENIEQEVKKQLSEIHEATVDNEENTLSSHGNLSISQETPVIIVESQVPQPAQEKISSLLNDWEENDSQEGNDSTNEIENSANEVEEVPPMNSNSADVLKDDKIKILVSDWDDEEEETKD